MMRKLGLITPVILVGYVLGLILARYASPTNIAGDLQSDQASSAKTAPDEENLPIEEATEPHAPVADPSVQSAASRFATGDSRLLAGDPAGALKEYEILLAHLPTNASAPLRYRVALCAESLGKLDRAMNEYGRLVSGCSNSQIAAAAQLGKARIWRDSNCPADARRAVWDLVLASRAKERGSTELQAECIHQLGQLLVHRTTGSEEGEFLSDLAIVDPPMQRSLRQALCWVVEGSGEIESHESDVDKVESAEDAPVRLTQQLGIRAEETYLVANLPRMPVAAVVELLAGKARLEVDWSPAARDRVSEHTVQIATPETTLAILLDGISDSMDLVWGTIRMQVRQEADIEFTRLFDMDAAERMLRRATTAFPDHELADDAYWALGNIGVRRGQWEVAILHYGQFLRQFSRSEARVGVHFNLAKTRLCLGDRDEAMQHFYHVVDEAPDDRLQPIAFLYLGRLYLEDDQAKRAIRPLTRSLARAQDDLLRATSAIALASAYLLLDNPHAANRILMTHRPAFSQGAHYDKAALLAALSRHQAASTTAQADKVRRPLLDAATHVEGADFFGAYGLVILAEAYQRLDLFEATKSTLLQGLEVVPQGGLRSRMLYALAEYHHDVMNMTKCTELLTLLAIDGDSAKGKSVTQPETMRPGQRHGAYSSSTHSHNPEWADGEIGSSNSPPAIAPASSNLHQRIVAGTTAVTGSPRRRVRIVICARVPGSRNRSEKNPIPPRLTSMLCPLHGGCPPGFVIRSSAENDVLACRRLSTCLVGSKVIGDCTWCNLSSSSGYGNDRLPLDGMTCEGSVCCITLWRPLFGCADEERTNRSCVPLFLVQGRAVRPGPSTANRPGEGRRRCD